MQLQAALDIFSNTCAAASMCMHTGDRFSMKIQANAVRFLLVLLLANSAAPFTVAPAPTSLASFFARSHHISLGCVNPATTNPSPEPPVLAGITLAPGLGYENRCIVAWMPHLVKDPGIELMRIPDCSFLAEPLDSEDSACSSILTPAHVALARRLLAEKETLIGVDALLKSRLHAPLHRWSDSELVELQSEVLIEAVREERAWLQDQQACGSSTEQEHEELLAALDVVRTHCLPCSGYLVLAPVSSLIPRSVPRGAKAAIDKTSGELVIHSDGSSKLALSAGWLTNDELLLSAGWALVDSATESISVEEHMLWQAADQAAKTQPPACDLSPTEWEGPVTLASRESRENVVQALRRFRYLEPEDELAVLAGGLCSDALGTYMQALCLSEEELALYGEQGCAVNIGETVPISRKHETRVGMALGAACIKQLESFPSSLAQDQAQLASMGTEGKAEVGESGDGGAEGGVSAVTGEAKTGESDNKLRQALQARISKKTALDKCRARCEAFVSLPTATATLRRPWKVNIRTSG